MSGASEALAGRSRARALAGLLIVLSARLDAAPTSTPASGTTPAPKSAGAEIDTEPLFQLGQQLFDELAPPEVKAEYEFPTKEQWEAFAVRLQGALQSDSLEDLAEYAPQARGALTTLRTLGADDDLADWLEQRLDELEVAREIRPARTPAPTPSAPPRTAPAPAVPTIS